MIFSAVHLWSGGQLGEQRHHHHGRITFCAMDIMYNVHCTIYMKSVSNGIVHLSLGIVHSICPFVWYLIDTVSFCCIKPIVALLHDQLLFFAPVETIMSHGSLLKATLKAILTYGYGELLCGWGCWALSYCGDGTKLWATMGVVLGWRPFRELRNIGIDPLSSLPPLLKIILDLLSHFT